jgi:hypothetical protein
MRFSYLPIYFILQVIEFYDPVDKADLSIANETMFLETEKFTWTLKKVEEVKGDVVLRVLGSDFDGGTRSGNISLTVSHNTSSLKKYL